MEETKYHELIRWRDGLVVLRLETSCDSGTTTGHSTCRACRPLSLVVGRRAVHYVVPAFPEENFDLERGNKPTWVLTHSLRGKFQISIIPHQTKYRVCGGFLLICPPRLFKATLLWLSLQDLALVLSETNAHSKRRRTPTRLSLR